MPTRERAREPSAAACTAQPSPRTVRTNRFPETSAGSGCDSGVRELARRGPCARPYSTHSTHEHPPSRQRVRAFSAWRPPNTTVPRGGSLVCLCRPGRGRGAVRNGTPRISAVGAFLRSSSGGRRASAPANRFPATSAGSGCDSGVRELACRGPCGRPFSVWKDELPYSTHEYPPSRQRLIQNVSFSPAKDHQSARRGPLTVFRPTPFPPPL